MIRSVGEDVGWLKSSYLNDGHYRLGWVVSPPPHQMFKFSLPANSKWDWLWRQVLSRGSGVEARSLEVDCNDWCPYKKRLGHRHTQRKDHVKPQGEDDSHRQTRESCHRRNLPTPWSRTFTLPNCEKTNSCRLSPPVRGTLYGGPSRRMPWGCRMVQPL